MNRPRRLSFLLLASVLLLSILLNFLLLYKEGFSNLYYAAAVKSMLMHNPAGKGRHSGLKEPAFRK